MKSGTRRPLGRPKHSRTKKEEANRHERIADVEHENETIAERAVAGPTSETGRLQSSGNHQQHSGRCMLRQDDPHGERQPAYAKSALIKSCERLWQPTWIGSHQPVVCEARY